MSLDNDEEVNNGPTVEELQTQLSEAQSSNEGMKAKMDKLLAETKTAKDDRLKAEAATKEKEKSEAKAAGDFEQLHNSSEEARLGLESQLVELRSSIANEKRDSSAMRVATELADGFNAELLSEHIAKRLKWTDDGVKVVDLSGNLTVATIDELKTEFQGSARFASLLKGSQASGGDATGGNGASGSAKSLSRLEFDKQSPQGKMKFIQGGGVVTS